MCGNIVRSYFWRDCDLWNDMLHLCFLLNKMSGFLCKFQVLFMRSECGVLGYAWVQERIMAYISYERLLDETGDQCAFANAI